MSEACCSCEESNSAKMLLCIWFLLSVWMLFKRQCIDCCQHLLLDGPSVPFYFWYIFVLTGNIKYNAHYLNVLSCVLKSPVSQNMMYFEASGLICVYHLFEGCYSCSYFYSLLMSSAVPKCIALDDVIINGIMF